MFDCVSKTHFAVQGSHKGGCEKKRLLGSEALQGAFSACVVGCHCDEFEFETGWDALLATLCWKNGKGRCECVLW